MAPRVLAFVLFSFACHGAAGTTRPLVGSDWESRLRAYQQRMVALYNCAVAEGVVSYGQLLTAVYGVDAARHPWAEIGADNRAVVRPTLCVTSHAQARVVVDPEAKRFGLHAYLQRDSGVIAVSPPGSRSRYDPLREANELAHEITHRAQENGANYPVWFLSWHTDLRSKFPDHPGTYLMSIDEMEVRLAELRRMIWVLGGPRAIDASLARQWLVALGAPGGETIVSPAKLPSEILDQAKVAFPGAAELLELLNVSLEGEAEVRRVRVMNLWTHLLPQLL